MNYSGGGQSQNGGGQTPRNEAQLQNLCFLWIHNTYASERGVVWHTDNNSVNGVVGAQKKALGVVKGISDLVWISPIGVIFIEIKFGDGRQTEEQKRFEEMVTARKCLYFVVKDFETFKTIVWEVMSNIGK